MGAEILEEKLALQELALAAGRVLAQSGSEIANFELDLGQLFNLPLEARIRIVVATGSALPVLEHDLGGIFYGERCRGN